MSQDRISKDELTDVRAGLRMAHPPDPEALAAEREHLASLESKGFGERTLAYLKLMGPGYMQSAMTLGGGTAAASLFAGALFGYKLLWVAPVAMLLGIVMLSAVAHQTLSTGIRPYDAMKRYAGAPLAIAWALGALISSIIWHFPQYALAAAMLADIGDVFGYKDLAPEMLGFVVLAWAIAFSFLYGSSPRLVRLYESALKWMVWGIVLCFGLVVLRTGVDWNALLRGLLTFEIPEDRNGIQAVTLILSGLGAAVGVNMLFLYPYSLLARGWGKEHRRMARFDLVFGMFVPYAIATSLMVIATANTIGMDPDFAGTSLKPAEAAAVLGKVIGPNVGRVVFGLGVTGMALSSITLQMLTAGFVCSELFGWEVGSKKYRLATLIPAPGCLGPIYWSDIAVWLAVPTNIICGLFLPAAYIGFCLLQRNRSYLGEDTPRGAKGGAWLAGMVLTTLVFIVGFSWFLYNKLPGWIESALG